MPKQASGYLAEDGKFFENEPECQRYEFMNELEYKCNTAGINYDNFMATLNAFHHHIKGYYNADEGCKEHYVGKPVRFEGSDIDDFADSADGPLPSAERDIPDIASGDK